MIKPIEWKDNKLFALDQRVLPHEEIYHGLTSIEDCHWAIKDMIVRGAPLIGFTAIYGMALWRLKNSNASYADFEKAGTYLKSARPTAVNLSYEVDRCLNYVRENILSDGHSIASFAQKEISKLEKDNRFMAEEAQALLQKIYPGKSKFNLMTHCNTGILACGCLGTALGVIQQLNERGMVDYVYADETRPYMQGTRLTSYELHEMNIPHSIVVEGAASYVLSRGLVDAIFVGADRIAANGDTANKIGTATLAIVANYYKIPFFIVAPTSSFDMSIKSGTEIEIELRPEEEITHFKGNLVAMKGVKALNPSFDVTPNTAIRAIFNEKGVVEYPSLLTMANK